MEQHAKTTQPVKYTSSLPDELINKLEEYSEKYGKKKNKVIETALTRFFEEERKREYAASFQKASQDKEMKKLADTGLDEFLTDY